MNISVRWSKAFVDAGWHAARVDAAKVVPEFRGAVPDLTPILVAVRRMPAPWPDIRIALPTTPEVVAALSESDPAAVENVEIELEEAAARAVDAVRSGHSPSGEAN